LHTYGWGKLLAGHEYLFLVTTQLPILDTCYHNIRNVLPYHVVFNTHMVSILVLGLLQHLSGKELRQSMILPGDRLVDMPVGHFTSFSTHYISLAFSYFS